MGQLTSSKLKARLRPLAYCALLAAAVVSAIGMFVPMTRGPRPAIEPGLYLLTETSIGETVGWSAIVLPVLLLVALAIDAVWPGGARWAALVLGAPMVIAASSWVGTHWQSLLVDQRGYKVPGSLVGMQPGLGIYLYGSGGLVAVAVGALIVVAPRRMRSAGQGLTSPARQP